MEPSRSSLYAGNAADTTEHFLVKGPNLTPDICRCGSPFVNVRGNALKPISHGLVSS